MPTLPAKIDGPVVIDKVVPVILPALSPAKEERPEEERVEAVMFVEVRLANVAKPVEERVVTVVAAKLA